jgi:hypothetical protein
MDKRKKKQIKNEVSTNQMRKKKRKLTETNPREKMDDKSTRENIRYK